MLKRASAGNWGGACAICRGKEGKRKGEKRKGKERKKKSSKGEFPYSSGGSNRKKDGDL